MPDHVRKQIRDAVKTKVTGLATTGTRVLVGRSRPLAEGHEPTLLVFTTPAAAGGQEVVAPLTMDYPRKLRRSMTLSIEGRVQAAAPCDDLLDTIAAEIESAMNAPRLGGLAQDCVLQSTVSQVDAVGAHHEGAIRLIYQVTYFTADAAPTVAL